MSSGSVRPGATATSRGRVISGFPVALLGIWLVLMAPMALDWLATIPAVLAYPYGLDYGEGIVWAQARMILRGDGYSDITELPFVVFHYPPVYHLLSAMVAKLLGIQMLVAGRLVSIAATIGSAGIILSLVFIGVRGREGWLAAAICALAAWLIAFSFVPVTFWGRLMRVDMAAFLLAFIGVWLALGAPERSWRAVLATVAFVAAMFAKQTMIAPPVAMLVVLLILRPRLAMRCALGGIVVGLLLLLVMNGLTGGGFTQHVISHNINRMSAEQLVQSVKGLLRYVPYIAIVLYYFRSYATLPDLGAMRERLARDPYERLRLFALVYYILASLMLLLLAKTGSAINYFLDWSLATSLAIGLGLAGPVRAALDLLDRPSGLDGTAARPWWRRGQLGLSGLFALLLVQFVVLPRPDARWLPADPEKLRELDALRQLVSEAEKPVISDEMTLLLQAGKEVLWESAIFAELAELGRWDDGPFLEMIRTHRFAFLVTAHDEGHVRFEERFPKRVKAAMREAYPRKRTYGYFVVHLPSE